MQKKLSKLISVNQNPTNLSRRVINHGYQERILKLQYIPVKNCLCVRIAIVRKLRGNIYISPPRSYPRGFLNTEMESIDNSGLNNSLDI